ncbi:MAG: TolC family protein [Sulfurimonas sp.]
MRLFLLLSLLGTVFAQGQILRLQDAIERTLQNHPDMKSFALKQQQANAQYDSTFSAYLPQVNTQGNYNALQTYVFPANGTFNTLDDDGWSAGVSLHQKVYDFEKTSSLVKISAIEEDIAKLSLEDFKRYLTSRVKSLYKLMIVYSKAIEVRKRDLELKQAYHKQSLALVKQGLKTSADATRFLSAVYVAEENLAIAKASYDKTKHTLSLYMGTTLDENLELENQLLQKSAPAVFSQKSILDDNYQLAIYEKNIAKSIMAERSTYATHFGSIDLQGSYTHVNALNSYDAKVLGVSINIPLYSGGGVDAEVQKARLQIQVDRQNKAAKTLALKEEIETLLIDLNKYEKTIEARKLQNKAAKQTLKVLQGRYIEGLATYIEVLDATTLELSSQLGLLEAYYQRGAIIDKLNYLKGKM